MVRILWPCLAHFCYRVW